MHEIWFCREILQIVQKKSCELNCRSVKKISLEIGQLMGIDQNSLIFNFKVVSCGTIAQDAILEVIPIRAKAKCDICKKEVSINQYSDLCNFCGGASLTVFQGEEFQVKSMEIN